MCDIILRDTYLNWLPSELLDMIILQIDDIDIKRHFGCYNRIDVKKYNVINNILINPPVYINNPWMISTIYNYKKNINDFPYRKRLKIPDDHIVITHNEDKLCIIIHRLVLKGNTSNDYLLRLDSEFGCKSSQLITDSQNENIINTGYLTHFRWETIKTTKNN